MEFMKDISTYAMPVLILLILVAGFLRNVSVYDVFLDGAREGLQVTVRIIPSLIGLMVGVGVLRASGALDIFTGLLSPIAQILGVPSEAMPLAVMRPVSGSASLALVSELLREHGPDSYAGRVISTMMGSTETIFYTLTVYFGSVGIKNIRYTLLAALIADTVSIIVSAWSCALIFGI